MDAPVSTLYKGLLLFSRSWEILKKLHVETYILIILPILWILISGFFERPLFSILLGDKAELWSRSLFFGGDMLKTGCIIFYLYIYIKLFIWSGQQIRIKVFKEQLPPTTNMKLFLLSFFYITIAIFFSSLLVIFTVKQSSLASSPSKMIVASELYMKMDMAVFTVDPRLWLIDFFTHTRWDFLLTYVYRKLDWAFALVLIGLLLFKKTLFRKYLIAFFLAPMIALPFWLALPAVTPNEMYRNNMFLIPSVNIIQQQYEKVPLGKNLSKFLDYAEENIENPKQKHPLVSTNPSMHVCWGFLITYFAILLWRPLGFIFIPWFILTFLSTIYTFQHYVIDIPAGIACAIFTIVLTNYLFKYERKCYIGNYNLLYFLDVFQEDIKQWFWFCFKKFKKSKKMNSEPSPVADME